MNGIISMGGGHMHRSEGGKKDGTTVHEEGEGKAASTCKESLRHAAALPRPVPLRLAWEQVQHGEVD